MASLSQKLKFLAIAGAGFFTDGYINLTIGLVVPVLGYLYFQEDDSEVPSVNSDIMKGGLSLGMIVGQVLFGLLSDTWGRQAVYGKELMVTLLGTLLVILLPWNGFSIQDITAWISVFRVLTGVGIGADYPLSSALSVESVSLGTRAVQVLSVFAFIGVGNYAASIVFLVLLRAFKSAVYNNINALEWVWRLLLGIGMVPAALTLYARLTLPETKPYTKYVANDGERRDFRKQMQDFREYFGQWKHAKVLFATSATWFLFDIAYYGINLNQSVILKEIGYSSGPDEWSTLWNTAVGNIIVQSAGYLPGFILGIPLPDRLGRVNQQFYASALVSILYAIWAGIMAPSISTSKGGLLTMFTLCQLVICIGPNCTTFLIPSEVFPTRVRGTAHGISAAAGKCGAVLTAFAFGTVTDRIGLPGVLGLFSGLMALTAGITLMIPETRGRSVDEIEEGVHYGVSPGAGTGSVWGDTGKDQVTVRQDEV
ncbi:inorganic phosphate transporter Pho84 [Aspergillus puulaauensis]|uniref:Inorganic phosphate transporter Pho84 n=1 Tax=Aspergillus puulaauensis TaxID=1220207 RepID=A0A7R7XGT8_9EURO|nr:inorganic phosphate transporter Pho84 [Aspergillus puulaauensis]BCS21077.1 inorganic phosphate transporter Pho84 [Aspergillus puulaauensis]